MKHLADIAIAIEELSHLHTFMWKAQHDEEVSRLELETQGEIDKLLLILQWLDERNESAFGDVVFDQLLGHCEVASHIEGADRELYKDAHDVARRLGRSLMAKAPESRKKMAHDFFRLNWHQKRDFKL